MSALSGAHGFDAPITKTVALHSDQIESLLRAAEIGMGGAAGSIAVYRRDKAEAAPIVDTSAHGHEFEGLFEHHPDSVYHETEMAHEYEHWASIYVALYAARYDDDNIYTDLAKYLRAHPLEDAVARAAGDLSR